MFIKFYAERFRTFSKWEKWFSEKEKTPTSESNTTKIEKDHRKIGGLEKMENRLIVKNKSEHVASGIEKRNWDQLSNGKCQKIRKLSQAGFFAYPSTRENFPTMFSPHWKLGRRPKVCRNRGFIEKLGTNHSDKED